MHVDVEELSDTVGGFKEKGFKIDYHTGSMRANAVRLLASTFGNKERHAHLFVSVEVLGRTEGEGGRVYTVGPSACLQTDLLLLLED